MLNFNASMFQWLFKFRCQRQTKETDLQKNTSFSQADQLNNTIMQTMSTTNDLQYQNQKITYTG